MRSTSPNSRKILLGNLADIVARRFMGKDQVWGNYTLDLGLIALLRLSQAAGNDAYRSYVRQIISRRNWTPISEISYKSQPFCCLNFELFLDDKNHDWLACFVKETEKCRVETPRSVEGAALHPCGKLNSGQALLIDGLQEYASRMARAGWACDDAKYFDACVEQFRVHRRILRNPLNGLWSNGRGWLAKKSLLSPGAWSRGHGWLIMGMVESLKFLPAGGEHRRELAQYLAELVEALERVQDADGMWHALLHRPAAESPPESSGTALISYCIAAACRLGILDSKYLTTAKRGFDALRQFVEPDGRVLNACPGPGPLVSEDGYLNVPGFPPDNEHGPFAMLLACVGDILVNRPE